MERETPFAAVLREYQADVNAIHFRVVWFVKTLRN